MEHLTIADLPFAEQVADTEYAEAVNRVLAELGKPGLKAATLDDTARRRFAYAVIIGRTHDGDTLRQIAAECDNGDPGNNDTLNAIARHPATPVDVITRLAWNKYLLVNERASSCPRLPAAELERLARDGKLGQKLGVIVNPSTPAARPGGARRR